MVGVFAAAWIFTASSQVAVVPAACIDSRHMLSHAAFVPVAPPQCGQFLSTQRLIRGHRYARA